MSIFKRSFLVQLPVLGLVALAAACGGDKGNGGGAAATPADSTTTAAAPAPAPTPAPAAAPASGNVVEVHMTTTQNGAAGEFQPSTITAKKGDTIRFIADGKAAHNVSFPPAENAGKSNLPPASPYLTTPGQTYEVVVNMDAGEYNFQCDPHAAMGMKGKLTVQ